jgi:hypothetical protein
MEIGINNKHYEGDLMDIQVTIDESSIKEIEYKYNSKSYNTVKSVIENILDRYLNSEYFIEDIDIEDNSESDSENSVVNSKNININKYILRNIKHYIEEILLENGYTGSLDDIEHVKNIINSTKFLYLDSYYLGKLYAFTEMYYDLNKKVSIYGPIVELISSQDVNKDNV